MDGNLKQRIMFSFLLMLVFSSIYSVHAALKSGTWQELGSSTNAINGTPPQADGAAVPVYQGSILLTPDQTHQVTFDAMPKNFSVDDASSAMQVVNPLDTEGDIFAVPPLSWENHQVPTVNLVWADAAAPDEPLNPQPVANKTFCAQNMAGRHLVVWPEIETADAASVPALYLFTSTGVPERNTLALLKQKIAIDVMPAVGNPVLVSADHQDAALQAAKVKVGESITLTVTTQGCDGNPVGNTAFVVRRDDAKNRKGEVNNNNPVHVGDTELTTTATLYQGTTDAQGNATVVVTQPSGSGVKTHLVVSSVAYPDLSSETDVVFTTLTSPDSAQAAMYGHMQESVTATLNGSTYTFTRPKLAAETSGTSGSVVVANETWAQFNWSGADNHCDILPDAEQLMAMRSAHDTTGTYPGWPLGEYWSSTRDQLSEYHYAVNMESNSVVLKSDSSVFVASCVDKALPPAHPQITLSPEGPYQTEVGESIELIVSVEDRDTHKPLPYRYLELFIDSAVNRKGVHKEEWDNSPVLTGGDDIRASSPEHYTAVTDANGQVHLSLSHDNGVGVKTPIRIVMNDDAGNPVTLPFDVIFTVITSPDVDGANMYGHMQGVVDAGNLYKRPLLAFEASHKTGQQTENNEEWATFNTVAAATSQCGTGQVPDTGSLNHLYSEHPNNQMLTEHGWPTNSFSYIAAETRDEQAAHVNLKTGDRGFSSDANYLTCSANEMVATFDVYFEDDPALRQGIAQVGQPIKMNVRSINALNGLPVPNADFTVTMQPGKRRDGLSTGFTDPSKDELLFDGVAYGAGQSSMTYHGMTDTQGNAVIMLTQPRGVGLLTPLNIVAVDSLIKSPISRSVKFTVATSPDTPTANMWGHMPDAVTVGDMTFTRPKLAGEVTTSRVQEEANESWARVLHADAAGKEATGGCAANRLPRIDQLQALYDANSGGAMHSVQGWPVTRAYWSSTLSAPATWKYLALDSGSAGTGSDDSFYSACLTRDNPVAASITIEPVDSSLWYDNTAHGTIHAVKVKKGDTLQLKVTVKDAAGQPLPQAPFVLSRGDGYTRQGEKHVAGSGDGIVSQVVIDGESLNDTATRVGKMTGVDGSIIINVTRPDTQGTRTALTAALYENTAVSASIDTIFTVITSPDSDKAKMWGHMLPSLTAADGTEYQRPLLFAELSIVNNTVWYTEDNESWAAFYGPGNTKTNPASCATGYYPSVDALDSLYSQYPNRTIKTAQGWPIDYSYWSGTHSQGFSVEPLASYFVVDLDDGSRQAMNNAPSSNLEYQICAKTPQRQATKILLSSPVAQDSVAQAVKAKVGGSIPLLVTTTDAAGTPMGNMPFTLNRDAGVARTGSYKSWYLFYLYLNLPGQTTQRWGAGNTYNGVTGADGTLAVELTAEDSAPGAKNILTARLYDTPAVTSTLPVIFTVITSPDSDKANMWGHMPETFTASNGAEFKRPLLYGELSSKTNTSSYLEANENWPMVNNISQNPGACPMAQMAALADLQALYSDHRNGAIATDLGLPLGKNWWAGDRKLSGQGTVLQYDNLKTGSPGTTSSSTSFALQLCLKEPRQRNITFDIQPWDAAKSAGVVKKGETIAATVTVTDGRGQPVSNEPVKISRGNALTRIGGSAYTTGGADDLTLSNIQSSSVSTLVLDSNGQNVFVQTNAQGQATFTIAQDKTTGLKTSFTVELVNDGTKTISKDVIFTVITSPDSDKAAMWGHMPETVAAADGTLFERPKLWSELSSSATGTATKVATNNESWAAITVPVKENSSASPCAMDHQPRLSELQSLYDRYPSGTLTESAGWPLDNYSWWTMDKISSTSYQAINLQTKEIATNKSRAYQVCLVEGHAEPASITLTSAAMDANKQAAVAKKGESLPLTVTVKDSAGIPMANQSFTLSRGDAQSRAGAVITANGEDDLKLQEMSPSSTTLSMTTNSAVFNGTTGPDGTATFTLRQDQSVGLKTLLTVKLASKTTIQSSLTAIFTVLTSPDTDKANYWGHMVETTTVDGKTLHRPWLQAELPSGATAAGHPVISGETWALAHTVDARGWDLAAQCGSLLKAPIYDELNALHAIPFSSLGWPASPSFPYLSRSPASGDLYCGVDETSGNMNCGIHKSNTAGFATCLP